MSIGFVMGLITGPTGVSRYPKSSNLYLRPFININFFITEVIGTDHLSSEVIADEGLISERPARLIKTSIL